MNEPIVINTEILKVVDEIKKLPFNQSWRSTFLSDRRKMVNLESGKLEEQEFHDFLFIPAPNIVRHYGSTPKFLQFRNENKFSKDYDFGFIPDKFENNNRRLAVKYVAELLQKLNVNFMLDNAYTIYIMLSELAKFAESPDENLKKLYMHFAIPKQLARKAGVREEWGV